MFGSPKASSPGTCAGYSGIQNTHGPTTVQGIQASSGMAKCIFRRQRRREENFGFFAPFWGEFGPFLTFNNVNNSKHWPTLNNFKEVCQCYANIQTQTQRSPALTRTKRAAQRMRGAHPESVSSSTARPPGEPEARAFERVRPAKRRERTSCGSQGTPVCPE